MPVPWTTGLACCWGMGTDGELGNGLNMNSATPLPVPSLSDSVTDIYAAGVPADQAASCAIRRGVGGGASKANLATDRRAIVSSLFA